MHLVETNQLEKKFGSFTAVNKVSLKIPPGVCFGLLGPNGAGKSTLISMIYGVCRRTGGDLSVFGMDPDKDGREIRKQLGVVPQNNYLDMEMNVFENMTLYANLVGLPKKEIKGKVDELLGFMSLNHKAYNPIRSLSGGMQRRLAFVRALLASPKLLILDEPTTGLDPAVRRLLWDKVEELKQAGMTILLTTHYMDEAQNLCDDIVVMDEGVVQAQDTPQNLIEDHCPGYLALVKNESLNGNNPFNNGSPIEIFQEQNFTALRASDIGTLQKGLDDAGLKPLLIRPTNLEDVFLKITGRELTQNA